MNKFVLVLCICFGGLFSFSLAGLVIEKNNGQSTNVDTTIEVPPLGNLEYVTVKFCDKGQINDREELQMRPGQTKNICIVFFNTTKADNDIKVLGQFSQGTLQANGVPNCSNEYSSGKFFNLISKYASGYLNISLAPGEKIIKHIKVSIPKTMTGNVDMYGCLVYQLDKKMPDTFSGIFYVVNAKASYIHIQSSGHIYERGNIDAIMFFWQDNKIVILKISAVILGLLLLYYIIIPFKNKKHSKHTNRKKS